MKIAIYAGSFDPITVGHMDVIKRARKIFDKLIVVVGDNPNKNYTFSKEERMALVKSTIDSFEFKYHNIVVDSFSNEYLISFAKRVGAQFLVRGIRSHNDFDEECLLQNGNKMIDTEIETVYLIPSQELSHVSSSFVKTMVGPYGWQNKNRSLVDKKAILSFLRMHLRKRDHSLYTDSYWEKMTLPHREYHTPIHVMNILDNIERQRENFSCSMRSLEIAAAYHDYEYDLEQKDSDNINKSIEKAKCHEHYLEEVEHLIKATDHSNLPKNMTSDQKLFHDMDLLILASNRQDYENYVKDLKKEYLNLFSLVDFLNGRINFLDSMMRKERIFLHPIYEHLNSVARTNMIEEKDYFLK